MGRLKTPDHDLNDTKRLFLTEVFSDGFTDGTQSEEFGTDVLDGNPQTGFGIIVRRNV